jgi:hypothetical protein
MFINNKSLGTNGLDPMSILKKKPAGTVEGEPKKTAPDGEGKQPQEKLDVSETKKGSAQLLFKDDLKGMRENWVASSKSGKPVKEISEAVKNGKASSAAIHEYMKAQGYSKAQMANVAVFLKDVMNNGTVSESKDAKITGRNLVDVMNDGLKNKGITEDQVKLLANGDFSAAAYLSLVKDGQSFV